MSLSLSLVVTTLPPLNFSSSSSSSPFFYMDIFFLSFFLFECDCYLSISENWLLVIFGGLFETYFFLLLIFSVVNIEGKEENRKRGKTATIKSECARSSYTRRLYISSFSLIAGGRCRRVVKNTVREPRERERLEEEEEDEENCITFFWWSLRRIFWAARW